MKKIKYLLIALLQFLVVCILWLVVMAEGLLTNALESLYINMSSPRSLKVLKKIVEGRTEANVQESRPHTDNTTETNQAVKDILYILDKRANYLLNIDRKTFEDTVTGRKIVLQHQHSHDYVVLRPTRSENMRRIENVLRAMTPYDLKRVHRNAIKDMQYFV
jgi:hypothetical protein